MNMSKDNFLPKDYLEISQEINKAISCNTAINRNSKDSAWIRAAVSRAYYSAFLSLKYEFLNSKFSNIITGSEQDHKIIKMKLDTLPSTLRYVATYFGNLRFNRNHADYDLPDKFQVEIELAKISNQQAERIINALPIVMKNLA